ncbi:MULTISPECIES: RNA polymerase sigma factor [Chryseobacterium]|uniref:RNA polymerase sigma-70 factor (ECF subfamily) n=1 Tax=Chryseobacterium geocarposphaerae TaxID=1416776 RepID=A0ABU1LCA3_9FLAO|nr:MULTISPECIES: sigma-70 family RNA polymerase sigma factor [Chryseobacterium]MDR6404369.1 RNA polymerase sigma-70 factor (ECF subfamily) [Chryseobacterium geocarposphaerae]MDR6699784.1 RNA polymerase sigma-70 factor (ECF subfamily) [Chryseobacterium ginsenosidimutans]
MKNLEENFKLAKKQDRRGQQALYEMFSAKMLAIANSYVNNIHDAEDILMNSFFTCFSKIDECREWKSFQFWLRKIVVNNSINFIRKSKNILYTDVEVNEIGNIDEGWEEEMEELNMDEIFSKMPDGYRLIFNLYVFEEKKHSEIAEILNISEGTSKSQLSKSKKWIVDFLKQKKDEKQYAK